ncbi:AAA family ATPase [Pseudonocardia abyssalis]|uniref:AAA family ATPase n=1 Tax=Pseudonocardia abyssalis TaxID=2792008 RepID=UPI001CED6D5A|nr:MoxR family ATPase [Pseudonocardia abyssalis]
MLEGPPGTSKSTILRAITAHWGVPFVLVESNAELTPARLVGHHGPARVLREDYSADHFVAGPLVEAMRGGGFLHIEELNRAPEDTLSVLLGAMAERAVTVPRVGTVTAPATFRVLASMNPFDNVGTARVYDRWNRFAVGYQSADGEHRCLLESSRPRPPPGSDLGDLRPARPTGRPLGAVPGAPATANGLCGALESPARLTTPAAAERSTSEQL